MDWRKRAFGDTGRLLVPTGFCRLGHGVAGLVPASASGVDPMGSRRVGASAGGVESPRPEFVVHRRPAAVEPCLCTGLSFSSIGPGSLDALHRLPGNPRAWDGRLGGPARGRAGGHLRVLQGVAFSTHPEFLVSFRYPDHHAPTRGSAAGGGSCGAAAAPAGALGAFTAADGA